MANKTSGVRNFFSKLKPAKNDQCCNVEIEEVKSQNTQWEDSRTKTKPIQKV